MIKRIILIFLFISLTACNSHRGIIDFTKPPSLNTVPPKGPAVYQQGWIDGCGSGLSASVEKAQMLLKTYKYKYDPRLRYNRLYEQAWHYAYKHCAFAIKTVYSNKYL